MGTSGFIQGIIMKFLDKLTGKARREEEARQKAVAEAEAIAKKEARAKKREAKKAEATAKKAKTPKDIATEQGEPWVEILSMELNPEDPGQGAFELDWNDKFVANLVRAGYQGKTDQDIVDNWFQTVCRNVVLETYEQEQADPEKRSQRNNRKDLGNGRTEIS